jgi:integrase
LLGLSWEDVDFEAGTVRVWRQLQYVGHAYELVDLKTDRSRRTLPLPPLAVDALRAHRRLQNERRLMFGSAWKDTGLVFTTATTGNYLMVQRSRTAFNTGSRRPALVS